MAYYYNNTNTSLYIYHSELNKDYLNNIIETWENVQLISICKMNINVNEYNEILKSAEFWRKIKSEYVLIFQTDTMLFKQIPDEFYKYDFIGALNIMYNKYYGLNGGLSLRKVKVMENICLNNFDKSNVNEDIYFYVNLKLINGILPTNEVTEKFALEAVFTPQTNILCGVHAFWMHHNKNTIRDIFKININI